MATTTNFGWETPDDTDLVKDGAAAIRTALGGVDTSFVDLKGGTTGQVLAKASNTDLDFTWTADASGIPATIFDAKGDIIAASAADTAARLAVGANNTVLTADSSTATGLKWATPVAGGMTQIASTSLSGSSTTVSSIPSTYKTIFVVIDSLSTDTNAQIEFTVNSSTSGYAYSGTTQIGGTSATYGSISDTRIRLSASQTSAASATSNAYALSFYNYASTTGLKIFDLTGWTGGNVDNIMIQQGGTWRNSSAITSCTVTTVSGNFDGGTITVYGVN